MSKWLKTTFRYVILLSIVGVLIWLSLNSINSGEESKFEILLSTLQEASFFFLILSVLSALSSHFIRGLRWQIILKSIGYETSKSDNFFSVMIGYFINLVIPRGGEVSRCYNMFKLRKVPTVVSLGTVISERLVDVFLLFLFVGFSFFIEFDKFIILSKKVLSSQQSHSFSVGNTTILVFATIISASIILLFLTLKNEKFIKIKIKFNEVLVGIKQGMLSIFKIKERFLFLLYSFLIWFLYYIMTLCVMQAFPETKELGLTAAITIFTIGGIAMAVPLPGGAGSYHVLVPMGMVTLYNLDQNKAVAFTFIYHGWQTLIVIIFGTLSLIISNYKISKMAKSSEQNRK